MTDPDITLIEGDATDLRAHAASYGGEGIADESVHSIVTSPPYNIGADYGIDDLLSWPKYMHLARRSTEEMYRVLVPGGRVWINIQSTVPMNPPKKVGNKNKQTSEARVNLVDLWTRALDKAGFLYRDTVVWVQDSHDGACAWGSRQMPSAPNQRGGHEIVLSYYKEQWKRPCPPEFKGQYSPRFDLGGDWYNDLCRNVWRITPARAKYPSPFPVELPARCIRLSTWPGEIVLDPFMGGATTLLAARQLGRRAIGVEYSATMMDIAIERMQDPAVRADVERQAKAAVPEGAEIVPIEE